MALLILQFHQPVGGAISEGYLALVHNLADDGAFGLLLLLGLLLLASLLLGLCLLLSLPTLLLLREKLLTLLSLLSSLLLQLALLRFETALLTQAKRTTLLLCLLLFLTPAKLSLLLLAELLLAHLLLLSILLLCALLLLFLGTLSLLLAALGLAQLASETGVEHGAIIDSRAFAHGKKLIAFLDVHFLGGRTQVHDDHLTLRILELHQMVFAAAHTCKIDPTLVHDFADYHALSRRALGLLLSLLLG